MLSSREKSNSKGFVSAITQATSKVLSALEGDVGFDESQPCSIVFKGITKHVKGANGVVRPLVYQVSGEAQPGEMLAIMGMSGCGKTTLLQVIGGRNVDQVTGQIFIQGIPFDKVMRSHISYVWQDDVFFPAVNFTVRDQLMFTSYVQMPYSDTHQQIVEAVNRVLETMHLAHCADNPVHFLSGGEKRRVSIAKELLTDPRVLLIDEGTSGLDSAAAFDLLNKLKSIAVKAQIPVVMSIHQPSSRAFHLFDNVLMMSEGLCVYRGKPHDCMSYVTSFGFAVGQSKQENYNPADFMIDVLYLQVVDEKTGKWPRYALMSAWLEKEAREEANAVAVTVKGTMTDASAGSHVVAFTAADGVEAAAGVAEAQALEMGTAAAGKCAVPDAAVAGIQLKNQPKKHHKGLVEYQSSYFRQVYANFVRAFKTSSVVQFGIVNVLQNVFMAVLVGLVWFQIPNEEKRVGDFAGYLFFEVAYWFFAGMFEGMLEFIPERAPIRRELVSGDYRLSAYFVAKTLAGTPVKLVLPWLYITISYFMVAKEANAETYFAFTSLIILSTLVGNAIGMFIGSVTLDVSVATSLTTVAALAMLIVGGFYLKELPPWLEFLSSLSMVRFAYRAIVQVVYKYSGDITCNGGYWIYACYAHADGTLNTSGVISGADAVAFVLDAQVDSLSTNIYVLFIYYAAFWGFSYLALLWAEYDTLFKEA